MSLRGYASRFAFRNGVGRYGDRPYYFMKVKSNLDHVYLVILSNVFPVKRYK